MKKLLGGTCLLALASLAYAAPPAPQTTAKTTASPAAKHSLKHAIGKHMPGKHKKSAPKATQNTKAPGQ